jgi:hypothetical protein
MTLENIVTLTTVVLFIIIVLWISSKISISKSPDWHDFWHDPEDIDE